MLEKFGLDKALEVAVDFGADFLLGKKKFSSDRVIEETGAYFPGNNDERSGGFLGRLASTAVKTFGSGASAEQQQQDTGMSIAEIQRAAQATSRYRPTMSGPAQTQRFTPTNAMYLEALKRRMQSMNYDSNLERLTSQYTIPVRPTTAPAKPSAPGTTTIKRTIAAPRLNAKV